MPSRNIDLHKECTYFQDHLAKFHESLRAHQVGWFWDKFFPDYFECFPVTIGGYSCTEEQAIYNQKKVSIFPLNARHEFSHFWTLASGIVVLQMHPQGRWLRGSYLGVWMSCCIVEFTRIKYSAVHAPSTWIEYLLGIGLSRAEIINSSREYGALSW